MLLLGTTDTLYEGDPSEVAVEPADITRILDEASVGVERDVLDPGRVRASFAGLRVLPGLSGETLTARRETQYVVGRGGMLTVAGGKLTTYRRIALHALERLRPELGGCASTRCPAAAGSRPRGRGMRIAHRFPDLDPATRSHVLHLYGSLAEEMLEPALLEPRLLGRSTRTLPTCSRRSGTRASRSGPFASRTCSGGGRHSATAAWRTPPLRRWRRHLGTRGVRVGLMRTEMPSSLEIAQRGPPADRGDRRRRRPGPGRSRAVRPHQGEGRPSRPRPASRDRGRKADLCHGDHPDEGGRGEDDDLRLAHAGSRPHRQEARALPARGVARAGLRH